VRIQTPELAQYLPEPPARVLEIGCGRGELAFALADAGYDIVAIDPEAPAGRIFRRTTIEELDAAEEFDAVVSQRTLHHVDDLAAAVAKIADVAPLLVVDDFGWDLLDEPTGEWYEGQRGTLVAAGGAPHGPTLTGWYRHHAGLHGFDAMRSALAQRFVGRRFEPQPYLYHYLGGEATEAAERRLIDGGAIRALGFRWIGLRR
jgi:SAM-dependent methyltransferase